MINPKSPNDDEVRVVARQRRAIITRENIINGAATVFDSTGYAAASINDIIAASGSTKGALYFHFPTKASVAGELVERWAHAARDLEERAVGTVTSPLAQLVVIGHWHTTLISDNTQYRAGLRLCTEPELDAIGSYWEWERRLGLLISAAASAGELRAAVTPRHSASAYCAMLIGLVHTSPARHSDESSLAIHANDLVKGWLLGIATESFDERMWDRAQHLSSSPRNVTAHQRGNV